MAKKVILGVMIVILIGGVAVFVLKKLKSEQKQQAYFEISPPSSKFKLESPAFEQEGFIPKDYTCDGRDISPPLKISGVSRQAKSLVLIVRDPDAPGGDFIHWLLWNISPSLSEIKENEVPEDSLEGKNDFGEIGYRGPCPPAGTHRYFFELFALDTELDLKAGVEISKLKEEIEDHILEKAVLIGKYQRRSKGF